jgi:hypothetical protein
VYPNEEARSHGSVNWTAGSRNAPHKAGCGDQEVGPKTDCGPPRNGVKAYETNLEFNRIELAHTRPPDGLGEGASCEYEICRIVARL